ncbi:phosphate ABC transporter permease subunit PstC [Luteithermobacter gelatinilyticus]|uniref:phosphate ABC transporter permease subunit PstC n=1 Tax=Luteithermobacter gelatinilyticus TaxID=2582913 RepID=UPI0011071094|nr:phosphate ABC transporter permease subunit PstC [Luteithermobacter gelatinilyticus]|tara:strand:+ start:872 stop:2254 length:1383 start_codon:yes stop_codon:yes gene_type:complete
MNIYLLILILGIISTVSFVYGRRKALVSVQGEIRFLHSLPNHYGWYAAMVGLVPGLFILLIWLVFGSTVIDNLVLSHIAASTQDLSKFELNVLLSDIHNLAKGDAISRAVTTELRNAADYYIHVSQSVFWIVSLSAIGVTGLCALFGVYQVDPELRSRNYLEGIILFSLVACSVIAILTTIGIVSSLVVETMRFFDKVSVTEFLFGLQWSPQTALRADQVGSSGAFGAVPLFVGTLLITVIALVVAAPIGLLSAIYMTEFASRKTRSFFKPLLEVLAGIPTVVYGFFAALVVAPVIRGTGDILGLEIASESALAAGLVMGIMIIPLMSSLSDDVIAAVPQSLRDGSYGLGATKTETILNVVLPAALPGIVSAFLLAASRAIGETMIVVMAAGMAANLTFNPLEAVTTVTVQIVALLTGDQEFDSAKTLSAFALGLALFLITLAMNYLALHVVRKYREQYD